MNKMKEMMGKRLNFNKGDKDNRGKLANLVLLLVIWFVKCTGFMYGERGEDLKQ